MSFVDVQVPYAAGQIAGQVGGAPTGGGNQVLAGGIASGPSGAAGPGGSAAVHHWVIGFYVIIAVVLISTGVIFNGKRPGG
jgi:hypothetical protein